MRILQLIPYFWPARTFGGPAKVVYELCEELGRKHNIMVYTSDAFNKERRIRQSEKIKNSKKLKIYYFKNIINSLVFSQRLYTNFGIIPAYLKNREKFQVIHINDVFGIPQILVSMFARFFNNPYIVSTHGVDIAGDKNKRVSKAILYKVFIKTMLLRANYILATSPAEARLLRVLGFNNVKVVYNGISLLKYKPSEKFSKYNKKDVFNLLYIGRINALKGLSELIESLEKVDFPIQLLVAGPDDGEKHNLIRKITNAGLNGKVHFLGVVNEKEKSELYGISDLFVYPSKLEGFSISILEAMANSLPVLITKACNFPDVEKFNAGAILKNIDERGLVAKKLEYFFRNKRKLNKMSANARRLVTQKYSIQKMAKNIEKIYETLG